MIIAISCLLWYCKLQSFNLRLLVILRDSYLSCDYCDTLSCDTLSCNTLRLLWYFKLRFLWFDTLTCDSLHTRLSTDSYYDTSSCDYCESLLYDTFGSLSCDSCDSYGTLSCNFAIFMLRFLWSLLWFFKLWLLRYIRCYCDSSHATCDSMSCYYCDALSCDYCERFLRYLMILSALL